MVRIPTAARLLLTMLIAVGLCADARTVRAQPAAAREAVQRAVSHLNTWGPRQQNGYLSLIALATLKAGEPVTNPTVAKALKTVQGKIRSGKYTPSVKPQHVYESGVDMMLLATADQEKYHSELQAITNYLLEKQNSAGDWGYLDSEYDGGDTSMVQYALLALWTAKTHGIDIPNAPFERAVSWLGRTQKSNGGFAYHPLTKDGTADNVTLSMTAAGASALGVARIVLYPESNPFGAAAQEKKEPPKKKFGVLEQVNVTATDEELAGPAEGKSGVPLGQINGLLGRGMGALGRNFTVRNSGSWHFYYLYTLERCASLAGMNQINGHDWYAEGLEFLLATQQKDGGWKGDDSGPAASTAFAIMFIVRATGKSIGAPDVGGGLLQGGRGLPDDLSELAVQDGEVVQEKKLGPLDELLKQLANTKDFNVADVQQAIVEKVEIGTAEDREKLIQQKDLLLRLVDDKRTEVRRTAMWALGRTDDLRVAKSLIRTLRNDNNVDVLVEARAALCVLSRRPRGFGFPGGPYDELPEDATDQQQQAALKEWRTSVFEAWRDWYLAIRPYDERDELAPFGS